MFYPFCKSIQPFLVKTKRSQLKDVITLVNIIDSCVIEYYDNNTIQDLPKLSKNKFLSYIFLINSFESLRSPMFTP